MGIVSLLSLVVEGHCSRAKHLRMSGVVAACKAGAILSKKNIFSTFILQLTWHAEWCVYEWLEDSESQIKEIL